MMAESAPDGDEGIYQKLRDDKASARFDEQVQLAALREYTQAQKEQLRILSMINDNSTLPATISSVQVLGAPNVRRSFLDRIVKPILSAEQDRTYTLAEAFAQIEQAYIKLQKHDIFTPPIETTIARSDPTISSTTPNDLDVYFKVKERGRYFLKTGTEAGNADASLFASGRLLNIFGGAESLSANVQFGTRTRSAYDLGFRTPILSNPDLAWSFGGLASSTSYPWASHEEVVKGGWTSLTYNSSRFAKHSVTYRNLWRQVTELASNASPSVRANAGDSVKSSLTHQYSISRFNSALIPTRGYAAGSKLELAGLGPLFGDVGFGKAEVNTAGAVPLPIPFFSNASDSGVSLHANLKGGLIYPFHSTSSSSSSSSSEPATTRLNDRFQLGGPTDVRGFTPAGLGPRDGNDSVGGDVYASGSLNLLFPLPRLGPESPIRFQAFLSGGRLFGLPSPSSSSSSSSEKASSSSSSSHPNSSSATSHFTQTLTAAGQELTNGLPSTAVGFGIMYAHPIANFELNFVLPLVIRQGEQARKGLQFGIGISAQ